LGSREAFTCPHAFSESAQKDRPGGSINPFWEPETTTSTPHSSMRRSAMPRLDTASTIRIALVAPTAAAMPLTSWSTPVEDSLCCISTALAWGCRRSASAKAGAGTVWPKGASIGITVTP
jgi:hypothetical protein